MEWFKFIVILICVLESVHCKELGAFDLPPSSDVTAEVSKSVVKRETVWDKSPPKPQNNNGIFMPNFSIYLIGFLMLFMLLAIIGLSVKLCLVLNHKSLFQTDAIKQYVRQESTGVTPLYNSNYDDRNKDDGSTLTVNSGIIEISESSPNEPITPTRIDDSKILIVKRPLRSIVPVMPKGQMDAICKEVLSKRKVQKSDSASFRDLTDLLNEKNNDKLERKSTLINELEKEKKEEEKSEENIELQELKSNTAPELPNKTQIEIRIEDETKEETKNEENKSEPELNKTTVQAEVHNTEKEINKDMIIEDSGSETEYDTVPVPIRYKKSDTEPNLYDNVENMPIYDFPPRHSDSDAHNIIQVDHDTLYLMPITPKTTDSCYVNAKRNSFHPS